MTLPVVTAVIVSYNSADDLRTGLPKLVVPGVEVVVVDNASTDASVDVARAAGARVIASDVNPGWAAGCNRGAAAATAPAIAFVNPDAAPTGADLMQLAKRLETSGVGIVSPRFIDAAGQLQPFYFRFPRPASAPFCFFGLAARVDRLIGRPFIGRRTYSFGADLPCEVDQPGAACMVVRADRFVDLGGFDEGYFLFFADTELCLKASERGQRVDVDWDIDVTHRGGGSVRRIDDIALQHHITTDYLTYARRNYDRAGRAVTVVAYVLLAGVVPAVSRLLRGHPKQARRHLTLMRAGLARGRAGMRG